MHKRDLLLEVGLEEMPARFVTNSMNELKDNVVSWLEERAIAFDSAEAFSTPRRLAVLVKGVAESQEDVQEEAKGPARKIAMNEQGEWSKAAIGFSKGQGASVEDIYFNEINGVEYAFVNKFIEGQKTMSLLPELEKVITGLHFPKNMKWANEDLRFVRPIKWITALFGTEVIPFSITSVQTSNYTGGHRFLGEKIEISEPSQYEKQLLAQYVIANPETRRNGILDQLSKLEQEQGWHIPVDQDLLEEVNNLVEYPTVLFGSFNEEFLTIPEEVLITTMKEHQRYFPVKNEDGRLLPYFVTVRNGDHRHLETVAKGNEKVLRARLSDADFFYKEDQKMGINDALAKLSSIVYHEEIGTLAEKVKRIRAISNRVGKMASFTEEELQLVDRAAEISKFDLVTHMVYEFPELQGFMGEKYALQKGEDPAVAQAINEHYQPRHADDISPSSEIGAAVGLADKMDTIVSCFAIGIVPTGSQDPYALRRQASGIVQTIVEKKWTLSIKELIESTIEVVKSYDIGEKEHNELLQELMNFFKMRLKYVLQEKQTRYDIIEAVLNSEITSVPSVLSRAEVLEKEKNQESFKSTIEALSRVINISKKAEELQEIDADLFENQYEKNLYSSFLKLEEEMENVKDEAEVFRRLAALRPAIDEYFDHTMVMAKDDRLKHNRLTQMKKLADKMLSFAAFNEIIVK
ncbi:glycine--tRNA ligase subunit beta [Falsibacillus albus]|uniref:Glycine--tRNA ligase beta subunit n=1 Tax=Falsibacillus albus TaxID=2478915 RepID=A0A3L7K587_9BACI|nr:glycine--tRNA ligase subunit beta [Falsibacillus albus]RLQ98188.1 glycine--tRNA ligase subunit beta [Falsibacillus albus]